MLYIYIYVYIYIHIYMGVPTDVSGPAMKDVLFENELSLFVTPRRDLFLSVSLSLTLSEKEKDREQKGGRHHEMCVCEFYFYVVWGVGFEGAPTLKSSNPASFFRSTLPRLACK
jgi:hypothetical protein